MGIIGYDEQGIIRVSHGDDCEDVGVFGGDR